MGTVENPVSTRPLKIGLIGCLVVLCLAVAAFFWMKDVMTDMLFVPKPRDTVRVQEVIRPILGDVANTVRVVRVDKDTNGYFFSINAASLERKELIDRLDQAGWDTTVSTSGRIVGRRTGDFGVEVVAIEAFDESEFYCGYDLNEESHFWQRFEENRQYMVGVRR
jgi:hypothetical protein